jgi:hypothetical protein
LCLDYGNNNNTTSDRKKQEKKNNNLQLNSTQHSTHNKPFFFSHGVVTQSAQFDKMVNSHEEEPD